jgi:hypothetical protein
MTIDKEDIRNIHLLIARHLEFADTVMVPKYAKISNDNLHFCSGPDDWQEYMYTEPDAYEYEAVDPRDIHEILLAIDEKQMPAREFVLNGVVVKGLVDIGSMLEDKAIIRDLHAIMPKINVEFQSPGELTTERGKILIEEIANNVQKLCKDDYGLTTANQLWDLYMANTVVKKPDLFIFPGDQWFAESLRQFQQVVEVRLPALFDRTVKDLAKGDPSTIHLSINGGSLPVAIYAEPMNRTLMVDLKASDAKDKRLSNSLDTNAQAISLDQLIKIVLEHQDVTQTPKPPRGDSTDDLDQNNISRGRKR